jgi:hypothetical protein
MKVTIRKNGVVVPSVTTSGPGVMYTMFEEVVTVTPSDLLSVEYGEEESDETT